MPFKLSPLLKSTWVSFFVSLLIIFSVKYYYRSVSVDGYWSPKNSDMLMQTLSAETLKERPVEALWYQHYTPPFLDLARAVFAGLSDHTGMQLVRDVDHGLLQLWTFCFAGLAAVLFAWAKTISRSLSFSWSVFFLWHLHPSGYAFATYLDQTMVSSFLITWFLFEWWKVQFADLKSSLLKSTMLLGLVFYVRVTFQFLFFIPHLIAVILMQGQSAKRKLFIFAVPLLICLPLFLKQFVLFDTFYTSTTSGEKKLGIIWLPHANVVSEDISKVLANYHYPPVAPNEKYNTEEQVKNNISYGMQFDAFVRAHPLWALSRVGKSVHQNVTNSYFKPSFLHAKDDYLINAFPYIEFCTWLLAGAGLIFWLTLALILWIARTVQSKTSPRPALVFFIPVLYVFLMSVLSNEGEWVEADRYKFFLEPTAFLFVCFEVSQIPKMLKIYFKRSGETAGH